MSRYEDRLPTCLSVHWTTKQVPGSFFGAGIFRHFAESLDAWAAADPGQPAPFGGRSLLTQSHGQSLMSCFRNRYRIMGLYLLDEPETALSPRVLEVGVDHVHPARGVLDLPADDLTHPVLGAFISPTAAPAARIPLDPES